MIFITTGTAHFPFTRLVDTVIDHYQHSLQTPVVIQSGFYNLQSPAKHIKICQYYKPHIFTYYLKTANLIVTAAGEATIHQTLACAKNKPIIFPRLHKYSEHVDDQQRSIARYFDKRHLAFVATTTSKLNRYLDLPPTQLKHHFQLSKPYTTIRLLDDLCRDLSATKP